MRYTKWIVGVVVVAVVAGLGLAGAHYAASRSIRRNLQAMQQSLPPGDVFQYKHVAIGLIGRSITFTDLRVKHGADLAAADRLVLRGVGRQSVSSIGADNLRVAEPPNVMMVHHLGLHGLVAPKPFEAMRQADWPLIRFNRLDMREAQGGFVHDTRSGAWNLADMGLRDYGTERPDHLELHGLVVKGGADPLGGLRLERLIADNPNLAATLRWLGTTTNGTLATMPVERRSGQSDFDNLAIGPEAAPTMSVQHVHMMLAIDPQRRSHSVLDVSDLESRAPQLMAFLTSLGYADRRFIRADLSLSSDYDPTTQHFHVAPLKLDVAGMAALDLDMALQDCPALRSVPTPAMLLSVKLQNLAFTYRDASLFDHVMAFVARQRGVSAGEVEAGLRADLEKLQSSGVAAAVADAKELNSFMTRPDVLRGAVNPPQPVPLSILALSLASQPDALQALNVTVKAH